MITLTLGGYEHVWTGEFIASFALAVTIVLFFAAEKFHEPTHGADDELPSQILPRYLTTSREYSRAHILYIGSMLAFLVVAIFAGPRALRLLGFELTDDPIALPLAVALVMVGSTHVKWMSVIELRLRKFAHERAFIPQAVRKQAEQLASAAFDFSCYVKELDESNAALSGVRRSDFEAPRGTMEYRWAKLSCLTLKLKQLRSTEMQHEVDARFLHRYQQDVDAIILGRNIMEGKVQAWRDGVGGTDGDDLKLEMVKLLKRIYILLACAMRVKIGPTTEVRQIMRPLGFVLPVSTGVKRGFNLVLVASALVFLSILLAVFAAVALNDVTSVRLSARFPGLYTEPFIYAVTAVLMHGAAMAAVTSLRRRRIASGKWLAGGRPHGSNYVIAALCAGMAGYGFMLLWSVTLGYPEVTFAILRTSAPFSILPAVTGAFYAWYLDHGDAVEATVRRILASVGQGATMAVLSLAAATASLSAAGVHQVPWDYVLYSGGLGLLIGTVLGWYIPGQVASEAAFTKSECGMYRWTLEREAIRYFGDQESARNWICEPNPALGGARPEAVARDMGGFERAWRALRPPVMPPAQAAA